MTTRIPIGDLLKLHRERGPIQAIRQSRGLCARLECRKHRSCGTTCTDDIPRRAFALVGFEANGARLLADAEPTDARSIIRNVRLAIKALDRAPSSVVRRHLDRALGEVSEMRSAGQLSLATSDALVAVGQSIGARLWPALGIIEAYGVPAPAVKILPQPGAIRMRDRRRPDGPPQPPLPVTAVHHARTFRAGV